MTITGLQQEGVYILLPVRVALNLQGNGLRRLEGRCPADNVHPRMLPPAHAAPPLAEHILKFDGRITINDIMHVVKEVMTAVLGPRMHAIMPRMSPSTRLFAWEKCRELGTQAHGRKMLEVVQHATLEATDDMGRRYKTRMETRR